MGDDMRHFLRGIIKGSSSPRQVAEVEEIAPEANGEKQMFPPGHFYSPIPSISEVRQNEERIFRTPDDLHGIDLNEAEQLKLFESFATFYPELPFTADKQRGLRYYFENSNYGYSDAICLYAMIRHLGPRKIVEVGSGYSSCVMLDTNELFFDNSISCTFIDPNPQLFLSLIGRADRARIELVPTGVQDAELNLFSSLSAGDILFIDSTHVSKAGSDVNHIVFHLLPLLPSGVFIHFHDIFYPFEYPKEWICDLGLSWNESYLMRAFLQYNSAFRIAFFNTYMEHFYEERFAELMPLCLKNRGGSLWLRKV